MSEKKIKETMFGTFEFYEGIWILKTTKEQIKKLDKKLKEKETND
ncbi:MAG: hypothetical protein ACFFDN_00500 [Candidatus Hodarchaeota archaeon]